MTTRTELISDWRERLAAAEDSSSVSSGRVSWMARARVRLYRFLLSLYGDGDWTTDSLPLDEEGTRFEEGDGAAVVFDAPDALPLAGKPAKSAGKIQSVLKSVADAQPASNQPGPLAGGVPPDSWVVAAALVSWSQASAFERTLRDHGIASRTIARGFDRCVEVRARDQREAARLLARIRPAPRPQMRRSRVVENSEAKFLSQVAAILLSALFGSLLLAALILIAFQESGPPQANTNANEAMRGVFFAAWLATAIGAFWGILTYFRRQAGGKQRQHPTTRRNA
jgi:hypothetical protein